MKKSKFTEAQVVSARRKAESGTPMNLRRVEDGESYEMI